MTASNRSFEIRLWRHGDEEVLVELGNNREIWRNLTNRFPYPYERKNAVDWIQIANGQPQDMRNLAIVVDGAVVGGVGFERLQDLHTRTAEIGYWIGEPFWGRGIATQALKAATALAFQEYDFARLQAGVIEWNPASCRVLEKVGYELEGRFKNQIYKDGEVCDQFMYSLLREDHLDE